VVWEEESQQAVVTDQRGWRIIFRPGESSYTVIDAAGGERIRPLDVPALMREGRVFLPLRVLLETFSYKVDWLSWDRMVDIQDTYPGWRQLIPPAEWKKALAEECEVCPLIKVAP
jgi:hypothetical protein